MENDTSTTNVDSKEEYKTKIECCSTTNVYVENSRLNLPPTENEYKKVEILNEGVEKESGVTTISVLQLNPGDKEKIQAEKKAITDDAIKGMIARGEIVPIARTLDSSFSKEEIEKINAQTLEKQRATAIEK